MIKLLQLRINGLAEPVGITGPILLGWVIESDKRGVRQESYQIQIAKDGNPVWDSGVVRSGQSAHIPVDLHWESITRYDARVRVTAAGELSDWLDSFFVTGFQRQEEWRGQFVSAEPEGDQAQSYGTLLRHEFSVSKPLKEAWLVCTAHGVYHSFLNGWPAGSHEMAPGWTSYHKRLLYQTHDVTALLHPGQNAIGVMLGAGWYKGTMGFKHFRNHYGTRTAFGGQLILRYEDGTGEWVCSDESWKGSRGPVLFSEIYDGETYDARQEQPGWDRPGFDDGAWRCAEIVERDIHTLFPQNGCPVRTTGSIAPRALFTTPEGDRVLDFGQNLTGWCEFTVEHPKAGDVIELQCFETLDAAGSVYTDNLRGAAQTLRYTCKGAVREWYRPLFTFQGFQYIKIVSWPGEPSLENFTARVVHSNMEEAGRFFCSEPLLDQLWHNILWSMKGNFLDIPTDCPQRDERLGWTGDAQAFARTASCLMNTDAFFHKWLADLAADQRPDGAVPHVVPDILTGKMEGDWLLDQEVQGGASGWGDAAVAVPWTLYLTYGDKEVLRRQMPSMLSWVSFMERHSEGCLFRYGAQFGDWLALDAKPGDYHGATPDDYTCAAWYCRSVELVSKMLDVIGERSQAEQYRAKAAELREDFARRFFGPDGALVVNTQTAHVLALIFGLCPEKHRAKTVDGLKTLLAQSSGHLTTGFMGTPHILFALSENGCLDEAYDLLLKEDFPSWLYQVKAGATTVWEHWDGKKPDGSMWSPDMNSFNHYAYGSVGEWLFRVVAGLELDEARPGYDHIIIRPQPGGGLTHAKAEYQSIHGKIVSGWERQGDTVTVTAEIPANTDADIVLLHAREVVKTDGLSFVPVESGWQAAAGSGSYQIVYHI